jgi:hypothetical protein
MLKPVSRDDVQELRKGARSTEDAESGKKNVPQNQRCPEHEARAGLHVVLPGED